MSRLRSVAHIRFGVGDLLGDDPIELNALLPVFAGLDPAIQGALSICANQHGCAGQAGV